MDADAIGPLLAVGGTALAFLGRRSRSSRDTPTVGERLSDGTNETIDAVAGTAQKAGTGITDLSVTGASMAMVATVTGAAGVVRAAGHATTTLVTGVVELMGHGASRSGGLILDGGVFLIEGLVAPLRERHRTSAPRPAPDARLAVVTPPAERAPEPPTPAKKAAAKKAPANKSAAKKAAAEKAAAKKAAAEKAAAKKAAAKKAAAKKAVFRQAPAN